MKLITGKEALDAAIKSIATRGKRLDRDIQVAALSAMQHHADHGDVTYINRLIAAMPKGTRVNALREYIQQFGGVSYSEETKEFAHDKGKPFDLDGASERSWTEFKPEVPYKPFDAQAAVLHIVKRVNAADPDKGDKVSDKQRHAILALANELGVEAA